MNEKVVSAGRIPAEDEIADAALYDQLKPAVTHTDILTVFNNLQAASLNNHLPQFNACK